MTSRSWLKIGRWALRLALLAWLGFGLWFGGRNIIELRALRDRGRVENAQIIGRELVDSSAKVGHIVYAYKTQGYAVEGRFAVARSMYPSYQIGTPFTITFLPDQPHTHQMGQVSNGRVLRTEFLAILGAVVGLLAFGLPLLAVELALQPQKSKRGLR